MTTAARVNEIRDALEQCYGDDERERYKAYARAVGGADYSNFEDADCGEHDSEQDYAEQLVDELGMLESMPGHLRYYFDYAAFARDLFINDYFSVDTTGGVFVFRNI